MLPKRYEIAAKALALDSRGQNLRIQQSLAEEYKCSQSTVSRYKGKYNETMEIEDMRRENGSQRKLSARDQRVAQRLFKKDPSLSLRDGTTALRNDYGIDIAPSTLKKCLNDGGLRSYRKAIKPTINPMIKRKRYLFALQYSKKTLAWWRKVCFSDESYFRKGTFYYKGSCWRARDQKYDKKHVKIRSWTNGLMVWGWFTHYGTGNLCPIEGKVDSDVYVDVLDEFLPAGNDYILLQDNAPSHTSKDTHAWFRENNIKSILDFPPYSPDLNPIENVWGTVKRRLAESPPQRKQDLLKSIEEVWNDISLEYLRGLVESMPSRLQAVINAKGGCTKY